VIGVKGRGKLGAGKLPEIVQKKMGITDREDRRILGLFGAIQGKFFLLSAFSLNPRKNIPRRIIVLDLQIHDGTDPGEGVAFLNLSAPAAPTNRQLEIFRAPIEVFLGHSACRLLTIERAISSSATGVYEVTSRRSPSWLRPLLEAALLANASHQ
jgi:hypothetical protein